MDSTDRVTVSTPGHGAVRTLQRNTFWGPKILHVEQLNAVRAKRDTMDHGATVFARSFPNSVIKREFRWAFVRSLLRTRRPAILYLGVLLMCVVILVDVGVRRNHSGLFWHVPVAFAGGCIGGVLMITRSASASFGAWQRSKRVRYCWLSRPGGDQAFGVLVEDSEEWSIVNLTVRSRAPFETTRELVDDVCRYADRSGFTLFINASDPEWLVDEYGFERAEQQMVTRHTSLVRRPSPRRGNAAGN